MTEILLCLYKQFVSYDRAKEKIGDFFVLTWLIFAGPVTYIYVFSMLSFVISDLVATLFMHSLLGMILLYLAASFFTLKVFLREIYVTYHVAM